MRPLLYHDQNFDVVLIDIPTSIAAAQLNSSDDSQASALYSCEALAEPHQILNRPKSQAALDKVRGNSQCNELQFLLQSVIEQGLNVIKQSFEGEWCLPRLITPIRGDNLHKSEGLDDKGPTLSRGSASKRKFTSDESEIVQSYPEVLPECFLRDICCKEDVYIRSSWDRIVPGVDEPDASIKWDGAFHNASDTSMSLHVSVNIPQEAWSFRIPPRSSFLLNDCYDCASFRTEFRNSCQEHGVSRRFECIILDPPWPNASARRKKAYGTAGSVKDVQELLLQMDLDLYLADHALVGIWITNKDRIRAAVLESGGIFDRIGVSLQEEWIWIKTTKKGEPVTQIDDDWRKPYEVFLLGRKDNVSHSTGMSAQSVRRRVIAAVPDIHSRKPCLKSLLEALYPGMSDRAVLEIFARHLVSGWWSWGNEVIKYNWEGHWVDRVK